jgi:hypothetical protein
MVKKRTSFHFEIRETKKILNFTLSGGASAQTTGKFKHTIEKS